MGLCLTLKDLDGVQIGPDITIKVERRDSQIRLVIDAPKHLQIDRLKFDENGAAAPVKCNRRRESQNGAED